MTLSVNQVAFLAGLIVFAIGIAFAYGYFYAVDRIERAKKVATTTPRPVYTSREEWNAAGRNGPLRTVCCAWCGSHEHRNHDCPTGRSPAGLS